MRRRRTVEMQGNCLARGEGRVIGDSLIDVQAEVITFSPCYFGLCQLFGIGIDWRVETRRDIRCHLSKAVALATKAEVMTAAETFML